MSDDVSEIVREALRDAQLCAPCVARRVALAVLRVDHALRHLVQSAVARPHGDACDVCGQVTRVYSVETVR